MKTFIIGKKVHQFYKNKHTCARARTHTRTHTTESLQVLHVSQVFGVTVHSVSSPKVLALCSFD